jgi:hypothetical protein
MLCEFSKNYANILPKRKVNSSGGGNNFRAGLSETKRNVIFAGENQK